MAGFRRIGRVRSRRGRGGGLSGPPRRGGLVGGGRGRACGRVGALGTRVLEGVTGSLGFVSDAAGALGDVLQLLSVRLEAVGATAPVNQLLRLALQAFEIHWTSWFAG